MMTNENKPLNTPLLTDGGLETTLVFHHGIELNHFAAFELLNKSETRDIIMTYYKKYLDLAEFYRTGFILESATWRANPDWGAKLGFSINGLANINRLAINQLQVLKLSYVNDIDPIKVSGCIGPRGDGYRVGDAMDIDTAAAYHSDQLNVFKDTGADMATALTMSYTDEALGITTAARKIGLPIVVSFTVGTDGNLPSGETLQEAIETIDYVTDNYPMYYMVNCAHPSHFTHLFKENSKWKERVMGIRANASNKSHAELDKSTTLDSGDSNDLAIWYRKLKLLLPNLRIYGGCCGTDESHVEAICKILGN